MFGKKYSEISIRSNALFSAASRAGADSFPEPEMSNNRCHRGPK